MTMEELDAKLGKKNPSEVDWLVHHMQGSVSMEEMLGTIYGLSAREDRNSETWKFKSRNNLFPYDDQSVIQAKIVHNRIMKGFEKSDLNLMGEKERKLFSENAEKLSLAFLNDKISLQLMSHYCNAFFNPQSYDENGYPNLHLYNTYDGNITTKQSEAYAPDQKLILKSIIQKIKEKARENEALRLNSIEQNYFTRMIIHEAFTSVSNTMTAREIDVLENTFTKKRCKDMEKKMKFLTKEVNAEVKKDLKIKRKIPSITGWSL